MKIRGYVFQTTVTWIKFYNDVLVEHYKNYLLCTRAVTAET